MSSPTQRTLALLRKEGYLAAICEKWNTFARIRQDLFGFADVLAVRSETFGVLAIQTTTQTNASSRREKLNNSDAVRVWLSAGNRVELWLWAKRGPRGKRKIWTVKREQIGAVEC